MSAMPKLTKRQKKIEIKIEQAIEVIKYYYLNSPKPFGCGFSGGKDSSVSTDLVVQALSQIPEELRTKKVYVQFSDTGREMGNNIPTINRALNRLDLYAKNNNLPIEVVRKAYID